MLIFAALLLTPHFCLQNPAEPEKKLTSDALSALSFRSIGPALMSGRIADVAVDWEQPNTWYVAAGSGGLWKTENAGTTWAPVFEHQASYSIGCVTIAPQDRSTIWVGSGDRRERSLVDYRAAVERSRRWRAELAATGS